MDLEQMLATDRVEARSAPFTDVDISKDGWSFEGLAAVYDQDTDLGDFTESVARGAYRKAIPSSGNIPMLYHHNAMLPVLATTNGGTLTLSDDAKGLRVKADIAQHYVGEAVRELVQRGDIKGMSTGFIAGAGNSKIEHRGSKIHRNIIDFKTILDVSPTWEPAYAGTTAELRSLRALQIAEDIEQVQQVLSGTYPQLEDRAPADEEPPVDTDGETDPDDVEETPTDDTPAEDAEEESEPVEQRSGVDVALAAAAARRRRLQVLGIALPHDA